MKLIKYRKQQQQQARSDKQGRAKPRGNGAAARAAGMLRQGGVSKMKEL
jgi:hypothetical protein